MFLRRFLLVLFAVLVGAVSIRTQEPAGPTEYQIKAVFIWKFLKYVEFPPQPGTNSALHIVQVGEDRFGTALSSLVESKTIEGRTVTLRHGAAKSDWKSCHLLFISDSERRNLPEILATVKGLPVLTVGESQDFFAQGGVINFAMKGNNVRLEINLGAAEDAGLKINSGLLRVADVVKRK